MSFTTFDPSSVGAHVTLSAGDLTAASTAAGDTGARSIDTQTSGLWYSEETFDNTSGGDTGAGIGNTGATYAGMGAAATNGAMVYPSGNVWFNGSFTGINIGALSAGDLVGRAVDLTNNRVWFRKGAAGNWNGSALNDPTTPSTGIDISAIAGSGIAPIICLGASSAQITMNAGASAFAGTVPTGYAGWPAAPPAATHTKATQQGAEVMSSIATHTKSTQQGVEVLYAPLPAGLAPPQRMTVTLAG